MRTLRAFVWLRWKLLVGGLRGGRRRDTLEQISRALAAMVPAIALALSAGSIVAVSVVGYLVGRAIGTGFIAPDLALFFARVALLALMVLLLFIPLGAGTQTALARYQRLLIMPISRRALHLTEVVAGLADPWVIFVIPGLGAFALGLLASGRWSAGLVAIVAGAGMVAVLASLGTLVSFLAGWLLRDRRRGEIFTLIFVLALSLLSIVPAVMSEQLESRQRDRSRRQPFSVVEFDRRLPVWTRALPSELYGRAVKQSKELQPGLAWLSTLALLAEAGLLFAASAAVHRRFLDTMEGGRSRRRGAVVDGRGFHLPGLPPAAAAVAMAQARTALRSVRGRLIVLMPGPLVALLVVLFRSVPDAGWAAALGAHGHLAFGAGILFSLYAMQAFTMNQFGSDRAGLSLQFLAPIGDADLVRGKAAGCALVTGAAVALCLVSALLVAPGGSPLAWLATLAAGAATYLILSPIAAWVSALFPVASDLSKTGSGGNPHGLAMLGGTILTALAALPAGLVLRFASPVTAFVLMVAWMAAAGAIAYPLLGLAGRTVAARRENLALVAQGR